MVQSILDFFQTFDPRLATLLVSMIPLTELRASIPFAYGLFDLPFWQIFVLAVVGDWIPALFLIWFLEPVSQYLSERFVFWKRFFDWLFERTRKKFYQAHQKWGDIGLILFIAIPLPLTGSWTGAAAAFLFGMPRRKAVWVVLAGVILMAIIVSAITLGAFRVF